MIDERTSWLQQIQATLFHHSMVDVPDQRLRANGRAVLRSLALPRASLQRIEVALAIIDKIDRQLVAARAGKPPTSRAGVIGAVSLSSDDADVSGHRLAGARLRAACAADARPR